MSSSLVDASEARKARLLALRKRKAGADGDDAQDSEHPVKHRNFDPETRQLRKYAGEDATDTVERVVDGLAEKIIAEDAERRNQELDVFSIAPKRPNWDLKREMERKLAKLERKTQEAILLLTRQRLAAQKGQGQDEDILGAMNAQVRQQEAADSSDED
ncbi:mRNA splicing factor [Exidia glandulosa HHB12029]|uniref:mRNA splicing factor n=1 Tax=Exidia glandulosa HHB12029 TaxID=1314781 RepID=A0A166AIE8_EXIGL|nr:mRNA splicing factor [Exidia glandulosa HHB12029]